MIMIIGLVILVAAVVAGVAGVLSNSGTGHALSHPFALFGYHVTGSTGTLFLPRSVRTATTCSASATPPVTAPSGRASTAAARRAMSPP
jgi:hypothetical protein